jgi:hypothetical protein
VINCIKFKLEERFAIMYDELFAGITAFSFIGVGIYVIYLIITALRIYIKKNS